MKIIQESPSQLLLESKILFGLLGSNTYVFDKAGRTLTISGKGLLGSKPKEHSLAGVTGVVLQEQAMTSAERAQPSNRAYRIELVHGDGSRFPLAAVYTSGKTSKERLVEKIQQFILSESGTGTPPPPSPQ